MEKTHSRAVEAIQPFLHLAASTASPSPRFIANLITNATSAPNTYVFAELLDTTAVQSLRSPEIPQEYRATLTLLETFAWGTWQDYHDTPNLPELNPEQTQKLRLLSLLTLCRTQKSLTYQTLMTSLSLQDSSALESLVTSAIYGSLITARLSPTTTPPTVRVISVAPLRDVRLQDAPKMVPVLAEWETRCGAVIDGLLAEIAKINSEAERNGARKQERTARVEKSIAGWDGDRDDDTSTGGGGDGAGGSGRDHFRQGRGNRGPKSSRFPFPGSGNSNKREFNATTDDDDQDGDDGYWDGDDGGVDISSHTSRMDIDEGAGAAARAPAGGNGGSGGGSAASGAMRQAKRMLAMGKKS